MIVTPGLEILKTIGLMFAKAMGFVTYNNGTKVQFQCGNYFFVLIGHSSIGIIGAAPSLRLPTGDYQVPTDEEMQGVQQFLNSIPDGTGLGWNGFLEAAKARRMAALEAENQRLKAGATATTPTTPTPSPDADPAPTAPTATMTPDEIAALRAAGYTAAEVLGMMRGDAS
jgi:hypothetical protein